eukprot:GFKZ01015858.1.p1 GENE.GFKZ01015858.1~~GFKZ01015858.1.p1  ORF type:complete len:657 (+),score=73.21 GFKZ01015858.1:409-2379(+)
MDGLWEGPPASPISAASTEHPSLRPQTYSPPAKSSMPPKRHFVADPSDLSQPWKRNRTAFTSSDSNSRSGSGSIVFVEAKSDARTTSPCLDQAAQDERRKALLLRLQAIERMKKNLSRQSPRPMSEDDLITQGKASGSRVESPNAVQSGPSTVVAASLPPRTRRNRAQQRAKPIRGKSASGSGDVEVIVVDDDTSTSSSARRGRGRATRGRKSTAQRGRTVAVPTRASSRVRRPRVLEVGQSEANNDMKVPTPTCMAKCKRFQFCKKLTTALVRDPSASFFAAPVKELWPPEAIPNYFEIITNPMDLRTVKRNLEFSAYICSDKSGNPPYSFDVEKYSLDMRLIFRNAMEYNKVGDMLYNTARSMLDDFDRKMRDELPDLPPVVKQGRVSPKKRGGVRKNRKEKPNPPVSRIGSESSASDASVIMVAPTTANPVGLGKVRPKHPVRKNNNDSSEPITETKKELLDRLNYLRRSRSAVLSRTPTPKGSGYLSRAALLYNVVISHSQKRKCAEAITQSKVPHGKMGALIDMVRGAVTAGDDEDDFELEFDRLDNKMWRNVEAFLEQYVPGFKTIRQSTLGREFATVQQVDEEVGEIQRKLRKISASKMEEESDDDDNAEVRSKKDTSFFNGDAIDDSSSDSESESGSDSSDDSDSDDE